MGTAPDIEIRQIDSKQRRIFAARRFSPDDVVFLESPLASSQFVWNRTCKYSACDFCLRPLETAEENARRLAANQGLSLPFPQCCPTRKHEQRSCSSCQTKYCSETCQAQAWVEYHQVLCALSSEPRRLLERLLEMWKKLHYPPETTSITLVLQIMACVVQARDREAAVARIAELSNRASSIEEGLWLERLFGQQWQSKAESLRQTLAELFVDEASVHHWTTPDGFRSLLATVVRTGQTIGTSALSVWVKNCRELDLQEQGRAQLDAAIEQLYDDMDRESGAFLDNEGSGLYPLQSLCRHSCSPNAEPAFPKNNHVLAMTAIKEIAPGEEITVSYLDECSLNRSRHTRQKLLRENYYFDCKCARCASEADQPDLSSDEEMEDDDCEDD